MKYRIKITHQTFTKYLHAG